MNTDRYSRASIQFDPPTEGSLDVRVYGPDGNLIRIIPGAVLIKREPQSSRETPKTAPRTVNPTVGMVKAKTRAGRP